VRRAERGNSPSDNASPSPQSQLSRIRNGDFTEGQIHHLIVSNNYDYEHGKRRIKNKQGNPIGNPLLGLDYERSIK